MTTTRKRSVRQRVIVDVALFVGFVAISAPLTTGIAVHEWLTLAFVPVWFAHLILDWDWITSVLGRSERQLPRRVRINRALNLTTFVLMVVVIWSGLVISEVLLPAFGVAVVPRAWWLEVHDLSSVLLLITTGAHLALHRDWIRRHVMAKKAGTGQAVPR